jgi:hypothetical protein
VLKVALKKHVERSMNWWFRLPLKQRALIAACVGLIYGMYLIFICALVSGIGEKEASPIARLITNVIFSVGIGPFGIGFAGIFYFAYLRKRAAVLLWLFFTTTLGVWLTSLQLGEMPSIFELLIYGDQLISNFSGVVMFAVPNFIFLGILCFWFIFSISK